MKKYNSFDIFLALSSLAIAIASYLLLVNDSLLLDEQENPQTGIAQIISKTNDVRIKKASASTWIPANSSSQLFQNQLIFSGENSSTNILFQSGSTISLTSNSLIEVKENSELDVLEGSINFDAKTPIYITLAGNKIKIEKGARISIKKSKQTNKIVLNIHKGSATLKTKSGKSVALKKNTKTSISDIGSIETKTVNLIITSPINGASLYKPYTHKAYISWDKIKKVKKYLLSIQDTASELTVFEKKTTQNKILIPEVLNCENCILKLQAYNSKNQLIGESLDSSFKQIEMPTPRFIEPLSGTIESIKEQVFVNFRWDQNSLYTQYEVAITAMKERTSTSKVLTSNTSTKDFKHGLYQVKVRGLVDSKNISKWSETFKLNIKNPPKLMAPIVSSPRKSAMKLNYLDKREYLTIKLDRKPLKDQKFKEYVVELSMQSNFPDNDTKYILNQQSSIQIELLKEGIYYWRAFYRTEENESKRTKVNIIDFKAPPLLQPIKIDTTKKILNVFYKIIQSLFISSAHAEENTPFYHWIKWNAHPQAKLYQFELYKKSDLTKPIKVTKVKAPRSKTFIPSPGEYFWRIILIDQYDRLGAPSQMIPIEFIPNKLKMTSKTEYKQKLILGSKHPLININWKKSIFDSGFEVIIKENKTNFYKKIKTKKNELTLSLPKTGKYEVQVTPLLDDMSSKSRAITSTIDVQFDYSLAIPKLDPIKRGKKHFTINWSPSYGVNEYHIILSEDKDFKKIITKYKKKDHKLDIERAKLDQDKQYYVKVKTIHDKFASTSSNIKTFDNKDLSKRIISFEAVSSNYSLASSSSTIDTATSNMIGFAASYASTLSLFNYNLISKTDIEYLSGDTNENAISKYLVHFGLGKRFLNTDYFKLDLFWDINYFNSYHVDPSNVSAPLIEQSEPAAGISSILSYDVSDKNIVSLELGIKSLNRLLSSESNFRYTFKYNFYTSPSLSYLFTYKGETFNRGVNTDSTSGEETIEFTEVSSSMSLGIIKRF